MKKDNVDDPRNSAHRTPAKPETKLKQPGEASDPQSRQPTITEQIYRMFQLERADRGYGLYQPTLRNRNNVEPLDQLLGPAANQAEDAESIKPDERCKDPNTPSQLSKHKRNQ